MKASELMLNDWVQHKGSPYRVCMITDIGVVTADDGICHFHFISKYLDPIPLTEDILVKNGFRIQVTDDNSKWLWVTDNSWLAYSERHNYWYYEDMKITYVHQLQHLLRLCGIEKEIEL